MMKTIFQIKSFPFFSLACRAFFKKNNVGFQFLLNKECLYSCVLQKLEVLEGELARSNEVIEDMTARHENLQGQHDALSKVYFYCCFIHEHR